MECAHAPCLMPGQLGEEEAHIAAHALCELTQVGLVLVCLSPAHGHLKDAGAAHAEPAAEHGSPTRCRGLGAGGHTTR